MPPDRREFLRLAAGASAGSLFLAACNDASVQTTPTAGALSASGSTGGTKTAVTASTTSSLSATMTSRRCNDSGHRMGWNADRIWFGLDLSA